MQKLSPNAPCSCGSGKKHKKCCLHKHREQLSADAFKAVTDEYHQELNQLLLEHEGESVEEINEAMGSFREAYNRRPRKDFLGWSSDMVYRMMNGSFEDTFDIADYNTDIGRDLLQQAPAVDAVQFFLSLVAEKGPLKATQKGNLPRAAARELFSRYFDPVPEMDFTISSEEECLGLLALRHIVTDLGWIKKSKTAFSLTVGGRSIVDKGMDGDEYLRLVRQYSRGIRWAFMDHYPELGIIQSTFLFNLYMLSLYASDWYPLDKLVSRFIKAFPLIMEDPDLLAIHWWEPRETVYKVYNLRFVQRYCTWLGLAEMKGDEYEEEISIRTTPLFRSFINWKIK